MGLSWSHLAKRAALAGTSPVVASPGMAYPAEVQRALRVLAAALACGALLSTRYLLQPFVWRHWSVPEVLSAWADLALEHLTIAFVVGLAAVASRAMNVRRTNAPAVQHAVVLAACTWVGAWLGEGLLVVMQSPGAARGSEEWAMRAVRWACAALALAGLHAMRQRALHAQAHVREAQWAQADRAGQAARLRLQALQAQIEPHFLFNTLATVRRLGETDPDRGETLLAHLHEFVRLSRVQPLDFWPLREELALIRAYLGVVEIRMGGLLRVRIAAQPEAEQCGVPPLTLATLVENAVKHGITPSATGGEIAISANCASARLEMDVVDSGVGLGHAHSGSGIGLTNTRARLQALYGSAAQLHLSARAPTGVRVRLSLPAVVA